MVLLLSGCKSNDINELKYLDTILIDNNKYTLIFADEEKIDVDETSLFSAIIKAEKNINRIIDTSYLKTIIFSDSLSYKDILKTVETMNKYSKFHPDTYLAIMSSETNSVSYDRSLQSTIRSFSEEVKVLPVIKNDKISKLCVFDNFGNKYTCPEHHTDIYNILSGNVKKLNFKVNDNLSVKLQLPPVIKPIINNKIRYDLKIKGEILDNNSKNATLLIKNKIKDLCNDFIKYNYQERNTDVLNIKKYYKKNYLSADKWNEFNNKFNAKDLQFEFNIEFIATKDGILLNDN